MVKAIKITLLSFICICLVGFMITFIRSGFKFSNLKAKKILDETYVVGNKKEISIEVRSSDIDFYTSDDENIRVKIYADEKQKAKVSETEDGLYIQNKRRSSCVGFCFTSNERVEIYVPESYEGKFIIKATSSDIESELTTLNSYKINVTSGDIELDNAKSLTGKTTSGDVEIGKLSSYIKFQTTSGDIDIEEFTVNKDSSIKVTSGDVTIDKCTNAYVDTKVTSGDVDVNKNDRHAEYELKIKTTSGDVKVN